MRVSIMIFMLISAFSFAVSPLPNVPEKQTQCIDHGRPCSKFVESMIGQYPPVESQTESIRGGQECWLVEKDGVEFEHCKKLQVFPAARLWTFRTPDTPRLHPDKLTKIVFIGSLASMIAAYATCNHQKEAPASEIPAIAAVGTLSTVTLFTINGGLASGPMIFGTIHYINAR